MTDPDNAAEVLAEQKRMDLEWTAWQAVCSELKRQGVDINTQDVLARTIEAWGEELVELRSHQSPEERKRIRNERRTLHGAALTMRIAEVEGE